MKKKDRIQSIFEIVGDAERRSRERFFIISYTTKRVAFKWNCQAKALKETTGSIFHTVHN